MKIVMTGWDDNEDDVKVTIEAEGYNDSSCIDICYKDNVVGVNIDDMYLAMKMLKEKLEEERARDK